MAILRKQFNDALTNIEISGRKATRAQEAHTQIRCVLEADPKLKEWGVDTILIGSYSRDTGIYPGKDVDVFAKMTLLDTSALPREVYDEVWRVLRMSTVIPGKVAEPLSKRAASGWTFRTLTTL